MPNNVFILANSTDPDKMPPYVSRFLFNLILCVLSTIFQLCRDGFSLVEPVLISTKPGLMCLAQGHIAVTPVRLEPAAHRSRVKHSHTEPLRSLKISRACPYTLTMHLILTTKKKETKQKNKNKTKTKKNNSHVVLHEHIKDGFRFMFYERHGISLKQLTS